MSAAETGIYITIVATMYERGEPIPIDVPRLARLCGASNAVFKKAISALIEDGKFIETDNGIWNERVGKELLYSNEKSTVARKAVNARWDKNRNENNASNDTDVIRKPYDRNTNQNPEPEPDKKDNTPTVPKGTVRRKKEVDPKVYEEFDTLVWREFPKHPFSRKDPAFKKYSDLTPELRAKCIGGVARYATRFEETVDPKRTVQERLQFVPHLVTWINQKGWESEYDA